MKKSLNLTILALLLFLAGCQKDTQPSTEQSIPEEPMAKPPSSGNTTINLSVVVDDLAGIQSDGQGTYINGTDRVQAQILSSDGNFFMNTNTNNNTSRPPVRTMHFPFGGAELDLENKTNYSLRTNAAIPLQNMSTNGGTQTVGFRVWAFQGGNIVWKLLFRTGIEDDPGSLTSYANVTRNGDTWTIVAEDPNAKARLADGNSPATPFGLYDVPFKLTLTKR